MKYLTFILFPLILYGQLDPDWRNITQDNLETYFNSNDYTLETKNFDKKTGVTHYIGFKQKRFGDSGSMSAYENQTLKIFFNKNQLRGVEHTIQMIYNDYVENSNGNSLLEFSKELIVDLILKAKEFFIERHSIKEPKFKIIDNSKFTLETNWSEVGDEIVKAQIKFDSNSITKTATQDLIYSVILKEKSIMVGDQNLFEVDYYDLKNLIEVFKSDVTDYINDQEEYEFFKEILMQSEIDVLFENLENETIALAKGFKNDDKIIIRIDPIKWKNASLAKRWYVLYHELGHDVFNFDHGQGGRMMFNYSWENITWDDFNTDKLNMFNIFFSGIAPKKIKLSYDDSYEIHELLANDKEKGINLFEKKNQFLDNQNLTEEYNQFLYFEVSKTYFEAKKNKKACDLLNVLVGYSLEKKISNFDLMFLIIDLYNSNCEKIFTEEEIESLLYQIVNKKLEKNEF